MNVDTTRGGQRASGGHPAECKYRRAHSSDKVQGHQERRAGLGVRLSKMSPSTSVEKGGFDRSMIVRMDENGEESGNEHRERGHRVCYRRRVKVLLIVEKRKLLYR